MTSKNKSDQSFYRGYFITKSVISNREYYIITT